MVDGGVEYRWKESFNAQEVWYTAYASWAKHPPSHERTISVLTIQPNDLLRSRSWKHFQGKHKVKVNNCLEIAHGPVSAPSATRRRRIQDKRVLIHRRRPPRELGTLGFLE